MLWGYADNSDENSYEAFMYGDGRVLPHDGQTSREFLAYQKFVHTLPETVEHDGPDWQDIDWSADRPDLTPADADAMARDLEAIRTLPEAQVILWHGKRVAPNGVPLQ